MKKLYSIKGELKKKWDIYTKDQIIKINILEKKLLKNYIHIIII